MNRSIDIIIIISLGHIMDILEKILRKVDITKELFSLGYNLKSLYLGDYYSIELDNGNFRASSVSPISFVDKYSLSK